jgi:4-hydroxythreonine-4-phosphate dehydrogenase
VKRIGITMGDASGVGPEILLRAFADGAAAAERVVAVGDLAVLEACRAKLGLGVRMRSVSGWDEGEPGALSVRDLGLLEAGDVRVGEVSRASGEAALAYVEAATRAALAGETRAVVTLPMNKEATRLSHPDFSGHTGHIAALCGVKGSVMMLASDDLLVTHVSTHVSLAEAVRQVKRERIQSVIRLTAAAARKLGRPGPLAVMGLNPHAGEGGAFGREEQEEIGPAVEASRAEGIEAAGPLPPDTVFYKAVRGAFAAVVCMYHDQGHIPMKMIGFERTVNVTLGLPIVRTSVDHGTAFDIAWQGTASTESFICALRLAEELAGA